MRYLRSYAYFMPRPHLILMYVIGPLLAALYTFCMVRFIGKNGYEESGLLLYQIGYPIMLLTCYEVCIDDVRGFNGLYGAVHPSRLELLKSAPHGERFFTDALYGDQIARFFYHLLMSVLSVFAAGITWYPAVMTFGEIALTAFIFFAVSWFAAQIGTLAVREIVNIQPGRVMCVFWLALIFGSVAIPLLAAEFHPLAGLAVSLLYLAGGIVTAIWEIRLGIRGKRREYHDT